MEGNYGSKAQHDATSDERLAEKDDVRASAGEPGGFSALQRERAPNEAFSGQGKDPYPLSEKIKETFGSSSSQPDPTGARASGRLAADYGQFPDPDNDQAVKDAKDQYAKQSEAYGTTSEKDSSSTRLNKEVPTAGTGSTYGSHRA